jgi:hypothetical protein
MSDISVRWTRAFWILACFHLTAWTLVMLLAYPNVSLDVAEITSYGHEHQLGYFKHPPLASWLLEAARLASGQQALWAIDLSAQLIMVVTFFGIWRLARRLLDPPTAFLVILALEASWAYTIQTIDFNHVIMVLPFFAFSGLCFYAALTEGEMRWWVGLGFAIGLGMLSNHIILFQAITIGIFVAADRTSRPWLRRPHPYVAAVIALIVFLPNLYWLLEHHFAPVSYIQQRYSIRGGLGQRLLHPLFFSFCQALFVAPMAVALAPWTGPWRCRPLYDERERWISRFLLVMILGPYFGFMLLSMVSGLKLDKTVWGMPFWLFSPLLALFLLRSSSASSAFRHTMAVALALIGVNFVIGATTPLFWPVITASPLPRTQFPGRLLSQEVDHIWHERFPGTPLRVVAGERWLTNTVAFYSPERPSVLTDENRLWTSDIDEPSCPWTSVHQFRASGGILLWYPDIEGSDLPWNLRRVAPGARVIGALSLPWLTRTPLPPVHVGVAVLPPG